jgi:RNAse (barnase) inhibitor barstar
MTSSEELKRLLLSPDAPTIVEAQKGLALDPQLAQFLQDQGYFVTLVDRAPVFNKETLMHALYQSCAFPAYFGFNWDALYDQLCEGEQGWVLIFRDFTLLQERSPEDAEVFKEVVKDAALARKESQVGALKLLLGQIEG